MENLPIALDVVHLFRWIATYPVDKVIRFLNNWGKVIFAIELAYFSPLDCPSERKTEAALLFKLFKTETTANERKFKSENGCTSTCRSDS